MRLFKTIYLSATISIASAIGTNAQEPSIEWTKYYQIESVTEGWDMIETSDGGYMLVGSYGVSNFRPTACLIKTNSNGDTLWTKSYGGNLADAWRSIKQTPEGGYIIAGYTTSFGAGEKDVYLVKTNSEGDTVWSRTFGGEADEEGRCVELTGDEGYIVAGWTSSFGEGGEDFYLIKIDLNGELIWERTYGTSSNERAWSVKRTPSGRYAILGWTEYLFYSDMYFILTDAHGNEIVTRTYGGSGDDEGRAALNVDYADYENFILCGKYHSEGIPQIYVSRITSLGYMMWERRFGAGMIGHSIAPTSDRGYIIGGYSIGSNPGAYIVKIRFDGNLLWDKNIPMSSESKIRAIRQTSDGGHAIAGYNSMKMILFKLAPDQTSDVETENDLPIYFAFSQNHPNPFNVFTKISYDIPFDSDISITIYNLHGQLIEILYEGHQNTGKYTITWNASEYPSGVYFARLEAGDRSENIKMVLLK
ncbi:MAG: T9SS type A sorting domain-containing protein [candidate division Zixibacteria bacterium]